MARFDKSGTKRPKQDAAVASSRRVKRSTAPSIEDTMFFPRLRRHAKWMFVFLAVALGGGFVLFGVGTQAGTGVGDLFRGGGGSSGVPSISAAQKQTEQNPKDIAAWRALSTALQTNSQTDKAIEAQRQVVALAPKDGNALRELSGLYLSAAAAKQQQAQLIQLKAAYAGAGQNFPGLIAPGGQPVVADQISQLIAAQAAVALQSLYGAIQAASSAAVDAYKQLAALSPKDPNVQLELAQAAQQAGDSATAILAFETFLKLAPDDPNASIVKAQLKQLKQTSAASG